MKSRWLNMLKISFYLWGLIPFLKHFGIDHYLLNQQTDQFNATHLHGT